MKSGWKIGVLAGLLTMGIAAQAAALPSLRLIGCQGTICTSTAITGGDPIFLVFPAVTIGDYTVQGSGFSDQAAVETNVQNTSIGVTRVANTSALPLMVWIEATGFDQPVGTSFILNTTHGATGTSALPYAPVTWQAWLSAANAGTGYVGPVGPVAGVATTLPSTPGVSNGAVTCTPIPGASVASCSINGIPVTVPSGSPYSLITRVTFSIPTGDTNTYTSNSQAIVTAVTAVPEPASMLLLGTGLVGLAVVVRRRRRHETSQ